MAITSRKLVLAVLMEKLVRCGFDTAYVIYGIMMHISKLNCLTSSLDKKICLIGNCSVSDSFHCIFLLDWLSIYGLLYVSVTH